MPTADCSAALGAAARVVEGRSLLGPDVRNAARVPAIAAVQRARTGATKIVRQTRRRITVECFYFTLEDLVAG